MYLLPLNREQLLGFLPPGGEVAEIGVAEGGFSRAILDRARPDRLHLIDPWAHQSRPDYANDPNNAPDGDQQARYEGILARFDSEIRAGRVTVHRACSQDAAAAFADRQFDWIYVDALHSYEAVASDLAAFAPKVRPDGFILGHDYANHEFARHMGFGVIDAVDEFVLKTGYSFLALTMDAFPTYVLSAEAETAGAAGQLVGRLLYNLESLVRVADYPRRGAIRQKAVKIGDRISAVFAV